MSTWAGLVEPGWTVELSVQTVPGTEPEDIPSTVTAPPDDAEIANSETINAEPGNQFVGDQDPHSEIPEEPTTAVHPNTEPEQVEDDPTPAAVEVLAPPRITSGRSTPAFAQQDGLPPLHKDATKVDLKHTFYYKGIKVSTQRHEWVRCVYKEEPCHMFTFEVNGHRRRVWTKAFVADEVKEEGMKGKKTKGKK